MAISVECVLDARAATGEGAIWSEARAGLWWVDIPAGRLHLHTPSTGENAVWEFGRPIGCAAETRSGKVVVALTDGFFELDTGSGDLTALGGPAPGTRGHRFNDGAVDPAGRFLAGTMPLAGGLEDDTSGTLYSLDGAGTVAEVMGGFHVINGMAFSPDGRIGYISDSFPSVRTIWAWDYDAADGAWSNRRVFFDTRAVAGRPDGATVDADGCYWMAGVSGWQLVRITPEGKVDMEIPMPVEKPSKIAFGGPDLRTMYVTSIRMDDDPEQPLSGGLFALEVPGVTGLPATLMDR